TQRDQPKYSRFAARSTSTTMRTMPRSVSSPAADGHLGDQRHAAQHELVAGPAGAADARDHRCAGTAGDEHHGPHVQGAGDLVDGAVYETRGGGEAALLDGAHR